MLTTRSLFYNTAAEVVRHEAPGFQDIVPTFPFIKRNGRILNSQQIHFHNTFLPNLNSNFQPNDQPVVFFVGENGVNTPRWLLFHSQRVIDTLLNLWPDGSPGRVINTSGDGTVLPTSAHLGNHFYDFPLSHHQLASNPQSIGKILNLLNLSGQIVNQHHLLSLTNTLIFLVASPVQTTIIDPQGKQYHPDNQGFVIIPNPPAGHFQAHFQANANGTLHFLITRLTPQKNFYNYYRAPVQSGQTRDYQLTINFNQPEASPLENENAIIQSCQDELSLLRANYHSPYLAYLNTTLIEAKNKPRQRQNLLLNSLQTVFSFRREDINRHQIPSQALLKCLRLALNRNYRENNISFAEARRKFYHSRRLLSLLNRLYRLLRRRHHTINQKALIASYQATNLLEQARQDYRHHNFSQLAAESDLAYRYLREALRFYRR